ncbi:MAG: aminotransferase class III-fold pyridoxal phosphate-dependent enzyme [Oscillospiraceae bacterium]|nr:aminotransferase class III-fold pyridoxal phosphate-dependent enzyme [Oscillospiraceae bacterium]
MFQNTAHSLEDILGKAYTDHLVKAATLIGMDCEEAERLATEKVDFWPQSHEKAIRNLSKKVGKQVLPPIESPDGAGTAAFNKATKKGPAPVSGIGPYRIAEDGKVYLASKAEHYHIPLGHRFPGYRLLQNARQLGILNATHNNSRGYITRMTERRLIADANGLDLDDPRLDAIIAGEDPNALCRVLNINTGSLAVEAGIKMMLARFYRQEPSSPTPKYAGKTPVFLVMGDFNDGPEAGYHGTTLTAHTFRGLWPDLKQKLEDGGIYKIIPVAINDLEDLKQKLALYNSGNFKTAGFLHEIVLMNYGAIALQKEYLQKAHALCRETDTLCLVDEIQSCAWYPEQMLFRRYGLQPDFVVVGKGFPGGENSGSKILCTRDADNLVLFGALITNGQEELTNLSYLITMQFIADQARELTRLQSRWDTIARNLTLAYPDVLTGADGLGYLASLQFADAQQAGIFAKKLTGRCIDTSAQLYKANCPPAALFKLPIILQDPDLELLEANIRTVLEEMKA